MIPPVRAWFIRWYDQHDRLIAMGRVDTPTRLLASLFARDCFELNARAARRTITRKAPRWGAGDPSYGALTIFSKNTAPTP